MEISRRSFIKGALGASAVAGLQVLGLPIASAEAEGPAAAVEMQAAAETADLTYGSLLNPQIDFSEGSDFEALFEPLKIGGKTMRNRFMKSAAGSETNENPEEPDEFMLGFYGRIAEGGVGMLAVESSNTLPVGDGEFNGSIPMDAPGNMKFLNLNSDAGIPAHRILADHMHERGCLILGQLLDMQMTAGGGGNTHTVSKMESSYNPGFMQSTESVQREIQHFADAGVRYYKAGYDGVEINAACNHYFSTFLSRMDNNVRTDQYSGASIENRTRIICEIIEKIRAEVGEDFIIQVLYNAVEENVENLGDNARCNTLEEGCAMAEFFERAGASSLHIRSHAYGHHAGGYMPDLFHITENGDTGYNSVMDFSKHYCGKMVGNMQGYAALLEIAAEVKKHVKIPVGVVGAMDPRVAPKYFNDAIKNGKVDFLIMNRPFLADPEYVKKLEEGRADEIAPCTRCMTCFPSPFDFTVPMYCRVNPALTRAGHEDMPEGYYPVPAEEPKRVMVIGGGPAGMEAARISAERGHKVTLYEKTDRLGGKMDFVQRLKGPHERIDDYRAYLIRQMQLRGVTVKTGTEVDAALVDRERPDIVIVAAGALCSSLSTLGLEDADGILNADALADRMDAQNHLELGDTVILIGAEFQACDVAENLARMNKKVILLNPDVESAWFKNGTVWMKHLGKYWLQSKGVKVYHDVQITAANGKEVRFMTPYGVEMRVEGDTVVNMLPMTKNRELFEALVGKCSELYAVGDCYSPNTIANATARANIIARKAGKGQIDESGALGENQYTATATGIGDVRVTITVERGEIVEAFVDTSNETEGIGRSLGASFEQQILEKGDIDAVSGASLTSSAVSMALFSCKMQAGLISLADMGGSAPASTGMPDMGSMPGLGTPPTGEMPPMP